MQDNIFKEIESLLADPNKSKIEMGLTLLKDHVGNVNEETAKKLFELVSSFFYIDILDRPDLIPLLDDTITIAASMGEWVIPELLSRLDAGDLKAQMAVAHALGRIGDSSVMPLINEFNETDDITRKAFALYALGKIKSPKVIEALDLTTDAARSSDLELCDTAIRALGKFAEVIPPMDLPAEKLHEIVDCLYLHLSNNNPGLRAKAVRSLGKLAKHEHLNPDERGHLKETCLKILGLSNHEWDRAFLVRKEAKETLSYLE